VPIVARNDNAARPWRAMSLGIAASLAVGVFLGTMLPHRETGGLLPAAVRAALEGEAGPVRVTATHVVDGGLLCRSFTMPDAGGSVLGLACHEADGWHLRAAVARLGQTGTFEPAGAGDPVIAEVLERLGAGPALSAEEEAAARRRGWQPAR
jgi:hypothetical protein